MQRTLTKIAWNIKHELGPVMFLTAVMQKVSGAQWGETDKVTYIGLRLRFHVVFSKIWHKMWKRVIKR